MHFGDDRTAFLLPVFTAGSRLHMDRLWRPPSQRPRNGRGPLVQAVPASDAAPGCRALYGCRAPASKDSEQNVARAARAVASNVVAAHQ